jgi:protein ImuB
MFACLYASDFLVQSVVRLDAALRQQPVAILDGSPPLQKVVALNPRAREQGMYLGMTKSQAELFAAKLCPRNLTQEAAASQALLDCAFAFSPRVEDVGENKGSVILDIDGLERLHGDAESIGQALQQLGNTFGFELNVGIAANPDAAALAAHGFSGITVVPSGLERERFGPLPIGILDLSLELQETFRAWGIHTLQALADLPEIGLIERLGQEGKRLQTLACGASQRPLIPREPELQFEESLELEFPLELLEPLTFVLARLLQSLCARLAARGLAAGTISLTLELEPELASRRVLEKLPHQRGKEV